MKTAVSPLIFCLVVVGLYGLRQKRATTVFRLIQPEGMEGCFDERHLTWQERAIDSVTGEYILQDVVRRQNLEGRWALTEREAMEALKTKVQTRLEEDSDVASITVRGSTLSEATELADALRDAYGCSRIILQNERYERLLENCIAQEKRQFRIVEEARLAAESALLKDQAERTVAQLHYDEQVALWQRIEQLRESFSAPRPAEVKVLQMARQGAN